MAAKKKTSKKAVRKAAKKTVKKSVKRAKKAAPKKLIKKTVKRTKKATVRSAKRTKKTTRRTVRKTSSRAKKTTSRAKKAVKRTVPRPKRKKKDVVLLESLLGSPQRARMIRLFTREPSVSFEMKEIAAATGVPLAKVRREAAALSELGMIAVQSRGGKRRAKIVPTFPFLAEMTNLATASFPMSRDELIKTLKAAGGLKVVIVAGLFTNDDKARVDLLVAADRYSEKRLARAIKKIEQQVAAEIRWAGMETKEFLYRWKMFDRFVRDISNRPHERVLQNVKF